MGEATWVKAWSGVLSVRREERDEGWIDLRLRNVMMRLCLMAGVGISMCMLRARWSEKEERVEPEVERLLMVVQVVQIRSRV